MPDHYSTLGLSPGASEEEIKAAFRKIALRDHPDRNQGDPEAEKRFKEASEAYQVLSDGEARKKYDRTVMSIGIPLEMFFKSAQARTSVTIEHRRDLQITLEEALGGCAKTIRIGFTKVIVNVPAGVLTGTLLRTKHQLFTLFTNITVVPHRDCTLRGRDVLMTVQVPFPVFVVGGEFEVLTVRGPKTIVVEPLSKSGVEKKFLGEGCSMDAARSGDLVVTVEVEVKKHNPEQLKRLAEYSESLKLQVPKGRQRP